MSHLDEITVLVLSGVAHWVLACSLFVFQKSDDIRRKVRLVAIAELIAGGGYLLFLWRKSGDLFWFSSVPNTCITLSYGLLGIALARLFGMRATRWLWGLVACTCMVQLSLREWGLTESTRLFWVVSLIWVEHLVILVLFIRRFAKGSRLLRFLTASNALIAVGFASRAIETLQAGNEYSFFNAGHGQTLGLLGLFLHGLVNGFGFSLLLREKADEELHRLATLDSLTEALNRRSFVDYARSQLAMADRNIFPVAVMLCDIDHFKEINDVHGHHTGDDVICLLVEQARRTMRASDCLGRWGGEEFVILMPHTNRDGAYQLGTRLRDAFGRSEVIRGQTPVCATVSIGVAECVPGEDIHLAIDRADAALYRAKAEGRNRVMMA